MFEVTQRWLESYPNAHAGILAMEDTVNLPVYPELEKRKQELEKDLCIRFGSQDPHDIETFQPFSSYRQYYKKFNKTYHVLGQLNSIVEKRKPIPTVATLVEVMFMAELKNGLLTAGHDLEKLQLPVLLDRASGDETYTLLRGQEQKTKESDMIMSDRAGIISSIIYGPDQRTQITSTTRSVLYAVYAPEGVDPRAILAHLNDIKNLILIFSPKAKALMMQTFPVDPG